MYDLEAVCFPAWAIGAATFVPALCAVAKEATRETTCLEMGEGMMWRGRQAGGERGSGGMGGLNGMWRGAEGVG